MKETMIGAFEAKTRLSEVLDSVQRGRTCVVTKRGRPVAEIRPVSAPNGRPHFGCDRDRIRIHPDFDAPLPRTQDPS